MLPLGATASLGSPTWLGTTGWMAVVDGFGEGRIAFTPSSGACLLAIMPETLTAHEVDVSPDGERLALVSSGLPYIAVLDDLVENGFEPASLACP